MSISPTAALRLRSTLGNEAWMRRNETQLKQFLPGVWTHMAGPEIVRLAFGLKLLGVDWRSNDDFGAIMVYLERLGILLRQNGYQVRANPRLSGRSSAASATG